MSTEVQVERPEELTDAVAGLRSDNGGVKRRAWLLVAHIDNNPNRVSLVGQGEGLESLKDSLQEDQVMYALIRLSTDIDMSTTVKFVYVHWVGEAVKPMLKGRIGVVHGSVQALLNPSHIQLETSTVVDLEEQALMKKLEETSGTRSKVLEGSVTGRQMRGFTQHAVPAQNRRQPRSVAPEGISAAVTPELTQAIAEVRDNSSPTNWVIAAYEEEDIKRPLTVWAQGSGGLEELTERLDDAQVMYALYRTSDTIDEIHTVKFVYLYWVGEQVKAMTKGRVSALAGPVEKVFSPTHVCLSFTNRYDITDTVIADKVSASSGSKSFVK